MEQEDTTEPTTIFVLGLLSIVACNLAGPVAWMRGNNYVNTCYALGQPVNQMGQIGRILGMVGTAILGLQFVVIGLYCCLILAVGPENLD
jgi:hypothetical protein